MENDRGDNDPDLIDLGGNLDAGAGDSDDEVLPFVGPNFPHGRPEPLDVELQCYSRAAGNTADERPTLDRGGNVILPPSILNQLTREGPENTPNPMLFHITNVSNGRDSHCGVLDFTAPEGRCFVPLWMLKNLGLQEGDFIRIANVILPKATYAKFKLIQSANTLEISDPKAILENALKYFVTLTMGDLIGIAIDKKFICELRVLETKPAGAVCCLDCDIDVDIQYSNSHLTECSC